MTYYNLATQLSVDITSIFILSIMLKVNHVHQHNYNKRAKFKNCNQTNKEI